jgi:hypothetical protein
MLCGASRWQLQRVARILHSPGPTPASPRSGNDSRLNLPGRLAAAAQHPVRMACCPSSSVLAAGRPPRHLRLPGRMCVHPVPTNTLMWSSTRCFHSQWHQQQLATPMPSLPSSSSSSSGRRRWRCNSSNSSSSKAAPLVPISSRRQSHPGSFHGPYAVLALRQSRDQHTGSSRLLLHCHMLQYPPNGILQSASNS